MITERTLTLATGAMAQARAIQKTLDQLCDDPQTAARINAIREMQAVDTLVDGLRRLVFDLEMLLTPSTSEAAQ